MVKQEENLDLVFGALSDGTRRAMLARLGQSEATVSQLAEPFDMSMPAITKHLNVLERAGLVTRRRNGRMKICTVNPDGAKDARAWIEQQSEFWNRSLDRLEQMLAEETSSNDA
jgi:DNA-binding transcriptional ArsR family regulator